MMPLLVIVFSALLGLFMFCIPGKTGLITKTLLSLGIAAAGSLIFLLTFPEVAMRPLGGT